MKIQELLKKYRLSEKDSGSIPVQIILLTEEINHLIKHLKKHKKDFDSKVGLLKMVGKRRRFLNYLQKTNKKIYNSLVIDLGLKK